MPATHARRSDGAGLLKHAAAPAREVDHPPVVLGASVKTSMSGSTHHVQADAAAALAASFVALDELNQDVEFVEPIGRKNESAFGNSQFEQHSSGSFPRVSKRSMAIVPLRVQDVSKP